MSRPVWLFSQDSDCFSAAPTTTGGLKAFYQRYGNSPASTDIEIVHFLNRDQIESWKRHWLQALLPRALAAVDSGQQPIAGFSVYTWNAAEFLELIRFVKTRCPDLLVIAGGPHVQQAEDYLYDDPIDVIVLGEGEQTLTELLDAHGPGDWPSIDGLAWIDDTGTLQKSASRQRISDLDRIPSALDVIPLTDDQGRALYNSIAYETSRGCPYKCAFCEWGTGAIGTKMHQFSLARIERDWRRIVAAGIRDIWLADSNFGALKQDYAKAELICELKQTTGFPSTFATSWSKKHNDQVQRMALMLHQHGLLPHYQLALQTLTPLALELSHRKNMGANQFQPIAREMARAGVPIAAELIWGLPGDNLREFEDNLDTLLAVFPNINIFGYTLLPGTEFYEKRDTYQIKTVPVAGYGKARGEYVVGCHTFDEEEGRQGYFLISAHMILVHGCIMPLTSRYLALLGNLPVSALLQHVLQALVETVAGTPSLCDDPISVYEQRAPLYVSFVRAIERCYSVVETSLREWMLQFGSDAGNIDRCLAVLQIDRAFCPRAGSAREEKHSFGYDAVAVRNHLEAMNAPAPEDFSSGHCEMHLLHHGGVGEILNDPDGAGWMKSRIVSVTSGSDPASVVETALEVI